MKAMVLDKPGMPLREAELARPTPGPGLLVRVRACGVCRTDVHVVDGDLPEPKEQVIPGHEIVTQAQAFARRLGAVWAGDSDAPPPEPLDAAIIFAPVGALLPAALAAVRKGGTVVCAGIHMSDTPSFPPIGCYGRSGLCARSPT